MIFYTSAPLKKIFQSRIYPADSMQLCEKRYHHVQNFETYAFRLLPNPPSETKPS